MPGKSKKDSDIHDVLAIWENGGSVIGRTIITRIAATIPQNVYAIYRETPRVTKVVLAVLSIFLLGIFSPIMAIAWAFFLAILAVSPREEPESDLSQPLDEDEMHEVDSEL